ncbi:6-phosphogluconate dehydrogenase [Mrakia frigida]|uniref:ketopantoate reductase family protein n=1 Tax=Mrakia frigida TaxID=29902 RepID=UPI003FCC0B42
MSAAPLQVLLFGMGGIGSTYACILQLAGGCEVSVIARSNLKQIQEKGLDFESSALGNKKGIKFAGAYRTPEEAHAAVPVFDYVICCSKALLSVLPALETTIAPAVTPGKTTVMIVQNGVGAEAPLKAAFPSNPLLTCVTWIGAAQPTPGLVINNNLPSPCMQFGPFYAEGASDAGEMESANKLNALFSKVEGVKGEVIEDMQTERWKKVIWNAAWNPTTALVQYNTAKFMAATPYSVDLCRNLMKEVVAVAQALGHKVPDSEVDVLMARCQAHTQGLNSSMQADVANGSQTEVEVILGTPLREAKRLGMSVPILETLYCCMKAVDLKHADAKA